jgi:hypothetical protein
VSSFGRFGVFGELTFKVFPRPASTLTLRLPVAEHAARATVWLQHRLLLGELDQVLDVARAVTRIQGQAATIVAARN